MINVRERPGGGHQGAVGDRGRSDSDGTAHDCQDDAELLFEVHRLVHPQVRAARAVAGGTVPGVGSPAWWAAPDGVRRAALLILGEAWLIHDPDRAVRRRLRELSWDLAAGHDWAAASRRPSHRALGARRAEPAGASRWVEGGAA